MDVISTVDVDVISFITIDKAGLVFCNYEEVDIRIFVYVRDVFVNGMKKIFIRIVDIDVVILVIVFVKKLEVEELWVVFGVGKYLRYFLIYKIVGFFII